MIRNRMVLFVILSTIALVASACSPAASPSPTAAPVISATSQIPVSGLPSSITHTMKPNDVPGTSESSLSDTDTSVVASQMRTSGGDIFQQDRFERPFSADMKTYYPNLDIQKASLARDPNWVYVTISLKGPGADGKLGGMYGVELDLNVDGRGDFLIAAAQPGADWSTDGVRVYQDANGDVGGKKPVVSEAPPQSGDGYETLVFDQGQGSDPDAAWARVDPNDPSSVQIAFKRSLIGDDGSFAWGVWSSLDGVNPAWFDLNDHFTAAEAGSPLSNDANYPLKALYAVDNTCRWGLGFKPTGNEPGVCPVQAPPTPVPQVIAPALGGISGTVWNDYNYNRVIDSGEPGIAGSTVTVYDGTCGGAVVGSTTSDGSGSYNVGGLPAGTYCVSASNTGGFNWYSGDVTVTLSAGGYGGANFGFDTILY